MTLAALPAVLAGFAGLVVLDVLVTILIVVLLVVLVVVLGVGRVIARGVARVVRVVLGDARVALVALLANLLVARVRLVLLASLLFVGGHRGPVTRVLAQHLPHLLAPVRVVPCSFPCPCSCCAFFLRVHRVLLVF